MENFELMGKFYLGKEMDIEKRKITDNILLYDSKDLTTHAMIIGMTGSGKTGLGMALLEEALMDNIPVIAIDPKGDITNLLLSFPDHMTEDYLPWINLDEAASEGFSASQYASREAEKWKKGLAGWGIGGDRIIKMRESVNFSIFTPGSDSGISVNMLGSFRCPPENIIHDHDILIEKVQNTTSNLLSLLNIESDPLSGKENLLISKIFEHTWKEGMDADLPLIINRIQDPPFNKIGIMSTDSFYPPSERFKLAMTINQVLASPSFSQWMTGVPLEMGNFLHTPEGKPRASIFTISHLSDNERMFFISMLLGELISWMRSRSGTSSLRAIVYIDEVFGYMPPVKEPPSKGPLLTLLKQARAFGIGVVLSTQNPVDLDYRGLSNIGTWFIGRLQTQRDKDRVLEGMEKLADTEEYDRQFLDKAISGLNRREFLLNNIHENSPSIFSTRWVMSYLRGPLSREQIRSLMKDRKKGSESPGDMVREEPSRGKSRITPIKPVIPPDINEYFIAPPDGSVSVTYKPCLLGIAETCYSQSSMGIDEKITYILETESPSNGQEPDWGKAVNLEMDPQDIHTEAMAHADFMELPSTLAESRNYRKWKKEFITWIRQNRPLVIFRNRSLKMIGLPGEKKGDFEIRIEETLREKRDLDVEDLRKKYDSKMKTLQKQLIVAEQSIARESEQANSRNIETVISFGSALAGALLGRKSITTTSTYRLGTALSRAGRLRKEKMDVERARERARLLQERISALENSMSEEIERLKNNLGKHRDSTEEYRIRARNSDINIKVFGLAWIPLKPDR